MEARVKNILRLLIAIESLNVPLGWFRLTASFLEPFVWAELKDPFQTSKPEPNHHEMRQLHQ